MAERADKQAGGGAAVETIKGSVERIELGKRAQSMARRAAESKATIPHLYLGRRVRPGDPGAADLAPSVVAAAGVALAEVPELNSSYRDGVIERHSRINVAFVLELEDGASAPVVLDADRKDHGTISAELGELTVAAREGSLASPALAGATFTVSLLESGADWFAMPVTPGQVAHLSVARPSADGELGLTLSCDQRAVRAPAGARFLDQIAGALGEGAGHPGGRG